MSASAGTKSEKHAFQAEANRLLHIVIHSLYTNKEIFLRELLSNASDALDKLRFRRLTEHDLVPEDHEREVRIVPDEERGVLTISDSGVGMTRDDLIRNLGTIAHSGTRAFLEAIEQGKETDLKLIGQFGVGFYSAFLVSDRVDVVTRPAGSEESYRWSSDGKGEFTVETADRDSCGTDLHLHLAEEQKDYLKEWRLRELVGRYSDYIDYPIRLRVERKEGEGDSAKTETSFETLNQASALWRRPKSEIIDEQYDEFYKHLAHDFGEPLTRLHFTLEGTQVFTALLFVPATPPFDLYFSERTSGLRLYVKRVFVMDDAEPFLPPWLRFVRGVVDSDDLPLNISRETLQDSAAVRRIKNNLTQKLLNHFEKLAEEEAETFEKLWTSYGPVLKEGIHSDFEHRERLAGLARFRTSRDEDWTTLDSYIERMPGDQEAIYYVLGESEQKLAGSPHVESLRARGYEYLYLTDPVDAFAMESLREYKDKKVVDAMSAELALDESEEAKKEREGQEKQLEPLLSKMREVLGDHVRELRLSHRLTDSPCCLVTPTGRGSAYIERLFRGQPGAGGAPVGRILEVNPDHPVVRRLAQIAASDTGAAQLDEWIEVLHDQALLTEGSPVKDPNRFARWITGLLEEAIPGAGGAGASKGGAVAGKGPKKKATKASKEKTAAKKSGSKKADPPEETK